MPSTTSSSVSSDLASSTVITPSLPTLFMASARNLPISASPLAEMVPTWAISSFEVTFLEFFSRSATTASTARSIPRFRSIGFMPAATDLAPSRTIAAASTVAVVVPSPAASADFEATSRTICAPMFSNLSSSSISLATVTPSLVMRGAPKLFSRTTFRPFGPSVTLTALARTSTPRSMRSRASPANFTSLAAILNAPQWFRLMRPPDFRSSSPGLTGIYPFDERSMPGPVGRDVGTRCDRVVCRLGQHAHDVGFLHDQDFLAIDRDLGSGPFAEQHAIPDLEIDGNELAGLVAAARTDCGDFALRGLFLGGVGYDDPALGFFFGLDALDHHTVMQRTEFVFCHDISLCRLASCCSRKRICRRPSCASSFAPSHPHTGSRALGVLIAPEYGLAEVLSSNRG